MPKKIVKKIGKLLEIPEDISLGLPSVSLLGQEKLIVENHKGILAYQPDKIILNTSLKPLEIKGQDLILKEITADIVQVVGLIGNVGYI